MGASFWEWSVGVLKGLVLGLALGLLLEEVLSLLALCICLLGRSGRQVWH